MNTVGIELIVNVHIVADDPGRGLTAALVNVAPMLLDADDDALLILLARRFEVERTAEDVAIALTRLVASTGRDREAMRFWSLLHDGEITWSLDRRALLTWVRAARPHLLRRRANENDHLAAA